jgi:hypothetical protein
MVNNNLVPVDFLVLDIECNASCPIILERPFLRTVGAIIDMKEGTIKYQFPLKKGMEHFPRRRKKRLMDFPFPSAMKELHFHHPFLQFDKEKTNLMINCNYLQISQNSYFCKYGNTY